ncbi:MAG: metallophosphoesterase [Desulfomonile tiedjei]|nr:metallophosphoesterase [Desulfomonile tiedjei]
MDRVFLFLAALGALAMLCQWYVFRSVRKYLFQRYEPVGRWTAYPVLLLLGLVNAVGLRLATQSDVLLPDSLGQKIAAALFFSYLGCVLALCLLWLVLDALTCTLRFKDFIATLTLKYRRGGDSREIERTGCIPSADKRSDAAQAIPELRLGCCKAELPTAHAELGPGCAAPIALAKRPLRTHKGRRNFLKWTAAGGLALVLAEASVGTAEGYERPVIEEFDLFHSALSGADRPFTFIQFSDFHFGMFLGTTELERLVEMVNSLEGDALFCTGDMYHSPLSPVELATPVLKKLRPRRVGNYAILGNHDFYTGEARSVTNLLDSGFILLRNRWVTLRHQNARIQLGGIDDPMVNWVWGTQFPNFPEFARRTPPGPGFRLLLSHRPNVLPVATTNNIDLVLAGHVHGGQIIMPVPGTERGVSIARVASPFTHGWYGVGKSIMYLNRGAGMTFVPWRVHCPPEITVFRLHASADETLRVTKRVRGAAADVYIERPQVAETARGYRVS